MDLAFLAFLAVNGDHPFRTASNESMEKFIGKDITGVHVFPDEETKECFIFIDPKTQDGIYRSWYESGKDRIIAEMKAGKHNGITKIFHEDGMLQEEITFEDNKPHGLYVGYFPNGKVKCRLKYFKGALKGACDYYLEDGTLVRRDVHADEHTICRGFYYPNGVLKEAYTLKGDRVVGKWYLFNEDGSIDSEMMCS